MPCPAPEVLRALAADPNPTWHSLMAWAIYVSGVLADEDAEGNPTGTYRAPWTQGRHLELIAQKLLDLYYGRSSRLVISLPPRHGKSQIVSKLLPGWWIGHRPEARVVVCTYAVDLTREFSSFAKESLAQHGEEVFGIDTSSRAAATRWDVYRGEDKTGGGMRAVGKTSGITGRDIDVLICDDIVKDNQEAQNLETREKAWSWFESVIETRLEPWSVVIVMGTRWHRDDLSGRIIAKQERGEYGVPWEILNIPAVAEEDGSDPLGREPGEPLWAERFGAKYYEDKRKDVGPHVWEALYQGNPTSKAGAIFLREWFSYAKVLEHVVEAQGRRCLRENLVMFGTADLAVTEKRTSDYSAFGAWGADLENADLYLLGLRHKRMGGPEILRTLKEFTRHWGLKAIYVEETAFHLQICQVAVSDGIPVKGVKPDKSKLARAMPATAAFEGLRIHFAAGAPWLPRLEAELTQFPGAAHDDLVDMLTHAVRIFLDLLRATRRG